MGPRKSAELRCRCACGLARCASVWQEKRPPGRPRQPRLPEQILADLQKKKRVAQKRLMGVKMGGRKKKGTEGVEGERGSPTLVPEDPAQLSEEAAPPPTPPPRSRAKAAKKPPSARPKPKAPSAQKAKTAKRPSGSSAPKANAKAKSEPSPPPRRTLRSSLSTITAGQAEKEPKTSLPRSTASRKRSLEASVSLPRLFGVMAKSGVSVPPAEHQPPQKRASRSTKAPAGQVMPAQPSQPPVSAEPLGMRKPRASAVAAKSRLAATFATNEVGGGSVVAPRSASLPSSAASRSGRRSGRISEEAPTRRVPTRSTSRHTSAAAEIQSAKTEPIKAQLAKPQPARSDSRSDPEPADLSTPRKSGRRVILCDSEESLLLLDSPAESPAEGQPTEDSGKEGAGETSAREAEEPPTEPAAEVVHTDETALLASAVTIVQASGDITPPTPTTDTRLPPTPPPSAVKAPSKPTPHQTKTQRTPAKARVKDSAKGKAAVKSVSIGRKTPAKKISAKPPAPQAESAAVAKAPSVPAAAKATEVAQKTAAVAELGKTKGMSRMAEKMKLRLAQKNGFLPAPPKAAHPRLGISFSDTDAFCHSDQQQGIDPRFLHLDLSTFEVAGVHGVVERGGWSGPVEVVGSGPVEVVGSGPLGVVGSEVVGGTVEAAGSEESVQWLGEGPHVSAPAPLPLPELFNDSQDNLPLIQHFDFFPDF